MNRWVWKCYGRKERYALVLTLSGILVSGLLLAQDGNAGIEQATSTVKGYFDAGVSLMYAVGAVLGLVGAIKVYQKWSHGDHDTSKVAAKSSAAGSPARLPAPEFQIHQQGCSLLCLYDQQHKQLLFPQMSSPLLVIIQHFLKILAGIKLCNETA